MALISPMRMSCLARNAIRRRTRVFTMVNSVILRLDISPVAKLQLSIRSTMMKSDLSHFGKQIATKDAPCSENDGDWMSVMPIPVDEIEYDEDCPPLESGVYSEPVHRFNGRVIQPRKSPTDPYDPEVLAFMRSLTPLVQMEPAILGGMPVFKNT